jgi:dCMP deaminase
MSRDTWIHNWFRTARHFSTFSKDPSTKIGAVAVSDSNQLLSIGWNGFPRGFKDDARLEDRAKKYPIIVHAEMNCIYNAARNGTSLVGSTMYVFGLPTCSACALGVVQSGIKDVWMYYPHEIKEKWAESFELSKDIYREGGVTCHYWIGEKI